ncbi:MAG: TIGR00266 family protein [Actinobacteria bacterium]|nr:MAG: TIGR00266 family protein [Actinomycetota bacterium]
MKTEIFYAPSYSLAVVSLASGEMIQAESGAMVSMSEGLDMQTSSKGGMLKGLKRAALGGESMFINTFTAQRDAEITMAPPFPGDIRQMRLENETMYVQSGSYMASTGDLDIDTKWGGAKTFFSGESLFLLKVTGTGDLLVSSYGAIHEIALAEGQKMILDTGHMVAFGEHVGYEVHKVGGWKQTILSGEGLVVHLTGPGRAFLQTRSAHALAGWLAPLLPAGSDSAGKTGFRIGGIQLGG